MVVARGFIEDNDYMRFSAWLFVVVILTVGITTFASSSLLARFMGERKLFIDFQLPSNKEISASPAERAEIKPLFLQLHNRLLAALIRMEYFEAIFDEKLSTLEKTGKSTDLLRTQLQTATSKTEIARVQLGEVSDDFEKIFLEENSEKSYEHIRAVVNYDIVANLQISHTLLVTLASELREIPQ